MIKVRAVGATEWDEVAAFCAGREPDDETRAIRRKRRRWLGEMAARGLTVLVAVDDAAPPRLDFGDEQLARDELTSLTDGLVVGLVEYIPIEETFYAVTGRGYLFVNCLWVIPPYLKRGVGRELLTSVIRTARTVRGGIVTVAHRGPNPFPSWAFMPEAFFNRFGMETVAADGDRVLMAVSYGAAGVLAFTAGAPPADPGLTFYCHAFCPASLWGAAKVRRETERRGCTDVKIVEGGTCAETRARGAPCGLSRDGRFIVNRVAFWSDVAAALGVSEKDDDVTA